MAKPREGEIMSAAIRIVIPVFVLIISVSCVSSKKYKTAMVSKTQCEEQVKSLTAEKQLLIHDTTQYGVRYRSLEIQKNFIQQTSASEIAYLTEKLEASHMELEELKVRLVEQSEELEQYQEGWQERQKILRDLKMDISEELAFFKLNGCAAEVKKGRLQLVLPADELFAPNGAELMPGAGEILAVISDVLKDYTLGNVLVEVHTDNQVPLAPYENNVDLSTARANTLIAYMAEEQSFPAEVLKGIGKGDAQPVASLETVEGRQESRRVKFIITPAYSVAVK